MISPTICVVATTMVINLLKIFDIVYVTWATTSPNTSVVAFDYYQNYFNFNDFGLASALAVILLIAIVPVMIWSISVGSASRRRNDEPVEHPADPARHLR